MHKQVINGMGSISKRNYNRRETVKFNSFAVIFSEDERFSMFNFTGFLVDVGTNPFGSHDPTTIDRSLNGPVIGFNFPASDEVVPGETTVLLVIETNALAYTNGFVSVQDGTAGFGFAYAPTAIPEPSSLALLGGGLTVVGALLRKFRSGARI